MQALSERTGKTYDSWDELVEAEANGYVAVAIITNRRQLWPWVEGPYPTKREANNARNRMRVRLRREADHYPQTNFNLFVRPAWKGDR